MNIWIVGQQPITESLTQYPAEQRTSPNTYSCSKLATQELFLNDILPRFFASKQEMTGFFGRSDQTPDLVLFEYTPVGVRPDVEGITDAKSVESARKMADLIVDKAPSAKLLAIGISKSKTPEAYTAEAKAAGFSVLSSDVGEAVKTIRQLLHESGVKIDPEIAQSLDANRARQLA